MHDKLSQSSVTDLCIVGIATDVCVHFTVMDAVKKHSYKVVVVLEGCAGIDEGNIAKCIEQWKSEGVTVVDTVDEYFKLMLT